MKTPSAINLHRSNSGLSLVELMMAAVVSAMLAGGLLVTLISVQRNFKACEHHATRQTEQLRVLDFMGLDLRRALTVNVVGSTINMTVPDYYDGFGNPRTPTITRGRVDYGDPTNPVPISYYMSNGNIFRNMDGEITEIASGVADMGVQIQDVGQVIEVIVNFMPQFQLSSASNAARESTTASTRVLLRNTRR